MENYKHTTNIIRKEIFSSDDIDVKFCLCQKNDDFYIYRENSRGGVKTKSYQCSINGKLTDINMELGNKILDRISSGEKYDDAFIFNDKKYSYLKNFSELEDSYTSTGIKFWKNKIQMNNYKNGGNKTVISTHVSPEGKCNLKCPYCSVTYRENSSRIEFNIITDYLEKLITRGLRAVILTGGGEPTLYPHVNELIEWIVSKGLSIALITNGTKLNLLSEKSLKSFSWIRISINIFNKWENAIKIDSSKFSDSCVLGLSYVYTHDHEIKSETHLGNLKKISKIADEINAKYVRVLPNCLLSENTIDGSHYYIDKDLSKLNDNRFFRQNKHHMAPSSSKCHQSFFRPYLSEEKWDGIPGSVYPCDSVVLNDGNTFFSEKYKICSANNILDYIDGNIIPNFNPKDDCHDCVFYKNINMLEDWKNGKIDLFNKYNEEIMHEEFV